MDGKTLVLRKDEHFYVVTSDNGDETQILLSLLDSAETPSSPISRAEVLQLIEHLGYELEVHDDYGLAG